MTEFNLTTLEKKAADFEMITAYGTFQHLWEEKKEIWDGSHANPAWFEAAHG